MRVSFRAAQRAGCNGLDFRRRMKHGADREQHRGQPEGVVGTGVSNPETAAEMTGG